MRKTVGFLSALLALTIAVNAVTPALSVTLKKAFWSQPQTASVIDYITEKLEKESAESKEETGVTVSRKKEAAYDDGKILIYNYSQLSMIGSGKSYKYEDGVTAVYAPDAEYKLARDISLPRHTLWKLPAGFKGKIGNHKMLYGGDADLLQAQNGSKTYGFQAIDNKTSSFYASVNQDNGEIYLDALHTSVDKDSSQLSTGEKYSSTSNYIIFRDIDLGGRARPWKPLMYSGEMYGAKSASGEKLWNGSGITDSTAQTATAEANRPQISNVYVNTDTIYNDHKLRVNDFIGIGFFATISNKTDTSNFGVSVGTAIVKNIDLNNVHVENNANSATVDETLLNAVTSGLGTVVGGLLDFLLRVLSFGSTSTDLRSTLSNLLNARAKDPTIYSTGAFAGRIYGDVVVEDCRVKGTVEVSNVKDRTGGFVGYTEGLTEYSRLSTALGTTANVLATILNVVPAVGLGDLITILLDNALPVGDLIPTGYIAPKLKNCEVNGLTGDVGKTTTNMAGGFIGQQIGTRIEGCSVQDSTYSIKAQKYGGGFCGLDGDLLYVNLLGLRVGVSLVHPNPEDSSTGTALITIGDSSVELPYNENGIDMNAENAEVVVNLIKGNRTRIDNCSVTGIDVGYDVYGGGASNTEDGTHANGYAGGFVGYNNEGKFTSDTMVYCDVVRGTAQKVGPFSGGTRLESVYSFNTLASIEMVEGEENHYSVYRDTDLTYALTGNTNQQIGSQAVDDSGTNYKRFDITHLAAPIDPGTNEEYYKIFGKWNGAKLASNASGANAVAAKVYVSNAKAMLMSDTPTYPNDESLIPDPGEMQDPCDETMKLTVQKIWNDKNNANGGRPDLIKVRIWQHKEKADGTGAADNLYIDTNVIPDIDTTDGWFTISKADHGRADSATWTRVIDGLPVYTTESEETYYYSYTVEENTIAGYSSAITYDDTGSTATATIVNTPQKFEILFKYYDRYEIDGKFAGIEDEETVYTVSLDAIPDKFITYDENHIAQSVNYQGLIGEEAVEFSNNALAVSNVMCEYDLWTSQSAAVEAISGDKYFYFDNGVKHPYREQIPEEPEDPEEPEEPETYNPLNYHTDYLGKLNNHDAYSGQEESKDEKWVSYYDTKGKEVKERFKKPSDYAKVSKIVVWCYNYPKQYNVDIYGADSSDDLAEKTVAGNTFYVADAVKTSDSSVNEYKFYYNQRFGCKMNDAAQDAGGFIENYGLARYTDILPENYAEQSFGDYSFAYWAYNQEGTQIASVEREFWYRVTTDTKLYAVYSKGGASAPGISISANDNDTFVDASGISRTRLNILGSIYGAREYDPDINKISFVNISLSTQIRDNPQVYTPEKVNALFEQYKSQLKELIEKYDREQGSKPFTTAKTYDGDIDEGTQEVDPVLKLTLTTKGYIYTVVPKGMAGEEGESTTSLTNKNRVQFTMVYKTSALNIGGTGSNGDTCLMYCAALKYKGEWNVSTNCLIYYNGEVVDNTADKWK